MTLAIVPNIQTNWYDPSRISGDPIITQNLNYTGGVNTLKSTSKTSIRLMQDMFKRFMPTTLRQGLGVSVSNPDMRVAAGDCIVNGRWVLNTTQVTLDASVLGDDDYYLIFELTEDAEGESRDPQNEAITLVAISTTAYTAIATRLVLAKFNVASTIPTLIASYTGTPAGWAVAAIYPPTSPDGSVYGSVELYSGAVERNLEAISEADGFRITEKLIIDDTDGTPVGKTHLRTIDQQLEARNDPAVDDDFVSIRGKTLKIGAEGDNLEIVTALRKIYNATIEDTVAIVDPVDTTKNLRFDVEGISPATTRVITPLDEDMTLVGRTNTQILTNKTISGGVFSGSIGFSSGSIENVSAAEFDHINSLAENVQDALNVMMRTNTHWAMSVWSDYHNQQTMPATNDSSGSSSIKAYDAATSSWVTDLTVNSLLYPLLRSPIPGTVEISIQDVSNIFSSYSGSQDGSTIKWRYSLDGGVSWTDGDSFVTSGVPNNFSVHTVEIDGLEITGDVFVQFYVDPFTNWNLGDFSWKSHYARYRLLSKTNP